MPVFPCFNAHSLPKKLDFTVRILQVRLKSCDFLVACQKKRDLFDKINTKLCIIHCFAYENTSLAGIYWVCFIRNIFILNIDHDHETPNPPNVTQSKKTATCFSTWCTPYENITELEASKAHVSVAL